MNRKTRRNIKDTFAKEYGGFCGWNTLEDTLDNVSENQIRDVFVGIFITGCRAMELPTLKRRQVDLHSSDTHIWIRSMYVEKQKERINLVHKNGKPMFDKTGKRMFKFNSIEGMRTFPIRRDNPFAPIFIEYVEKFSSEDILYPYSYGQIYYRVAQIGMKLPKGVPRTQWAYYKGPWWPHRIRAERACQILQNMNWNLPRLMTWFGWASSKMAELYGKLHPEALIDNRVVEWR